MTEFKIQIVSDVICPWCLVGHRRLSRAIANHKKTYPDDTFSLKYLPFYLNPPPQLESDSIPPFPTRSRPKQEVYAEKFGPQRTAMMFQRLSQVGQEDGISFKFGGRTGVSRNGHRLVAYAQKHGGEDAQNKTMMGLWRRYFEEETDITDLGVLVETGVEAGLGTAEELKRYLESGEGGREVDLLSAQAGDKGIHGVPHYEIQDKWEVSGAQDPVAFETLFKRWKLMESKEKVADRHNGVL